MKIAIFTNNYLPNPFGVSSSIESFRKELERVGHTVYIFAPDTKGYVDEDLNSCPRTRGAARVFRYPSIDINYKINFPLAIPFSLKLNRIIESLDIDVIHSQHPNLLGWEARKWAKKKNIPLIFTWHTLYDRYTHFAPPFIPKIIANWWVIRNAVRYANSAAAVISPTESVKKIIVNWGVKVNNISTIPTGVDRVFDSVDREIIRKKNNLELDETILFTNSRMTSEKNIVYLFEIIIQILQKNKKCKFMLVGDGNLIPTLKKIAKKAGVYKQTIFCGRVEKKDIGNYYAASDIFVYASKSETQGMIISEAMYTGLPIVAIDSTGISDQVMHGANGYLVQENRNDFLLAVEKLIDNHDLRKRFSDNGIQIAKNNYSSKICTEKLVRVYEKVIENKKA